MRALLSVEPGDGTTLRVGEADCPSPGPGEVRVRTCFAGINYPDVLIIEDRYQVRPPRPFAPGIEVAGYVEAVGAGVESVKIGQACVALLRYGGLAEYAVAPAGAVAALPPGTDLATAASTIVSYGTSWHGLHDRAGLHEGDILIVLGASGVVGLAAVEIGKALGARVIAGVSSEPKAKAARARGADDVVVYPSQQVDGRALAELFKAACGPGGATCVFDPVGGAYGEAALRALAWQGRYLVIGFAAALPTLAANVILLKSADVSGVTWGETVARTPGLFQRHMTEIGALAASGRIKPGPATVVPLEAAGDAIQSLAQRAAVGKIVVRISAD